MSCQRECHIVEIEPGQWYCILERASSPKDAWDWKEDADCFGPFPSAELAIGELDRHSNPGGFSRIPYSPRHRRHYAVAMKKPPASETAQVPFLAVRRS